MKKREFQKKAAAALLGKLADVVMELEENPNITITSEYHSSYFKLRKNYNLIQISVKQTGELTYQLTDMLGNTGRSQIYVQFVDFNESDPSSTEHGVDWAKLRQGL